MAGAIYFNGTELTGVHDVKLNNTDMDHVYFNGTKIWTKHPYPPGTTIGSGGWGSCNSGGSNCFMHTIRNSHPLAFASMSGCGSADNTMSFALNPGFAVTNFSQSQHGSQTNSITGGSYSVWVGNSVSGMWGTGLSGGSSGNCSSSLTIKYLGT